MPSIDKIIKDVNQGLNNLGITVEHQQSIDIPPLSSKGKQLCDLQSPCFYCNCKLVIQLQICHTIATNTISASTKTTNSIIFFH